MNTPLRSNAPRAHPARARDPNAGRRAWNALRWLPLCATLAIPVPALAQSDPKNPHLEVAPVPVPSQDVTPHPGMVIGGQVVIGQPAPGFELDGSRGVPVQLSSLRGDWTVLLFLQRMDSARDYADAEQSLREQGIRLVGICHEKARTVESFAHKSKVSWLLLADVTGEVGAMYGVWDAAQRRFMPGLMLIDPRGIVRYASIGHALSSDELRNLVLEAREKT